MSITLAGSLAPHLFWTEISEDEEGAKNDARTKIKAYRMSTDITGVGGADAKLAAGVRRLVKMTFDEDVPDEEALKIVDAGMVTIKFAAEQRYDD